MTTKLKELGITQLQHLSKLTEEKIDSLGLNEYQKSSLQQAINDLNLDYSEKNGYVKQKLRLFVVKKFDKEGALVDLDPNSPDYKERIVGWQGAVMGNKPLGCDFQVAIGADLFELYIKFQYGHYWLIGPSYIQRVEVFYRLKKGDKYILQPDNIIEMGDIQFVVQRFNTGAYEDKGTRHSMEDCSVIKHDIGVSELMNVSFYAVYDGHGGSECVTYIAQQLIYNFRNAILKDSFEECTNFYRYIHDKLIESFNITDASYFGEFEPFYSLNCGSTACVVIIAGDRIISANIGDSRAVLSRSGEALNLTRDHKPDTPDELLRIKNAGGFVATRRLLGKLAVSRSFGDFGYKRVGGSDIFKSIQGEGDLVLSVPEIRETRINYLTDEFILLGCDGLYDVFTSMECVTFIRDKLGQMPIGEQDPQAVAGELVRTAIKNSTISHKHSDNVSVIIVCLTRGVTTSFDQTIPKK